MIVSPERDLFYGLRDLASPTDLIVAVVVVVRLDGHHGLDLVLQSQTAQHGLHWTGLGLLHHLLHLPLLPLLSGPGLGLLGDQTHPGGSRGQTEVDIGASSQQPAMSSHPTSTGGVEWSVCNTQ